MGPSRKSFLQDILFCASISTSMIVPLLEGRFSSFDGFSHPSERICCLPISNTSTLCSLLPGSVKPTSSRGHLASSKPHTRQHNYCEGTCIGTSIRLTASPCILSLLLTGIADIRSYHLTCPSCFTDVRHYNVRPPSAFQVTSKQILSLHSLIRRVLVEKHLNLQGHVSRTYREPFAQ